MNKMSRAEIEASQARGERVSAGGVLVPPGKGSKPHLNALFALAREHVDAVVMNDAAGRLTHAGAVEVIRRGGSVLINGEIIDNLADLPDETVMAQGDERRLQAHLDALDAQAAQQSAERQRAAAALTRAREQASRQPQRGGEQGQEADPAGPTPAPPAVAPDATTGPSPPESAPPGPPDASGEREPAPPEAIQMVEPQPEEHQGRRGRHR